MAIQTVAQLKNWFRKGLEPLQSQFYDWMDSYWHKSEGIPQSSVAGLQAQLAAMQTAINDVQADVPVEIVVNGATTFDIPENSGITSIGVKTATVSTCKVGLSAGDGFYVNDEIAPGSPARILVSIETENALTLHFTGNFTAKLYK